MEKAGHRYIIRDHRTDMLRDQVETHQILRVVTGSHAYGLNVPTSDRDEKAVVIEPICEVAGLAEPWGGKVYSQAGTEDFEVYGLRKYLRLALKGNPTVTEMLFIQDGIRDGRGRQMQELYPLIVSKQAGAAYLGYMNQQRKHMVGERGNGGHGKARPDLVEKFGYDTKFAMHMLRLGLQGIELLSHGRLTLPLTGQDRNYLLGVRGGAESKDRCLAHAEELEQRLKELIKTSSVRESPDREAMEQWMLDVYSASWLGDAALPASGRIFASGGGLASVLDDVRQAGITHFGAVGVSEKK
jgi:hypothetical protein